VDDSVLQKLKVRRELMEIRKKPASEIKKIDDKIDKALDPNDSEPGVRLNNEKTWKLFKAQRNIKLKQ
jgi:hypothetical protein